ncbi:MAG TPA: hypothetical protein VJY47_01960 [Candidatus Dojkabacteria bacterium]|nr:hypothetical protein [Candidatus Dojkabacteria bacterium]
MKFLKKASIVLVILSFIFSPFLVFAENNKEEGKTITIEELALELPTITDNPSLIITFSDPSTEKEGVHLEIDKKGFTTIKSPYSLPALSIGNHLLKFKFVDKYGATQTIDKEIIIIPRAPILNTPSVETSQIIFSGSGLAGSEVILLLSTDKKMITKVGEVDEDGKWRIEVVDSIPTGTYSFTAYVRKYGYASNLADSMTLDIGNNQKPEIKEDERQKIHFSFKDIDSTNIKEVFSTNTDLIMLLASALVLGILFGLLFTTISQKNRENKVVEIASKTLEKPINTEEKPMTLREKLINKEVGFEKPVEEQPIEEEENVEPVVINEIKTASKSEEEPKKEEKERIVTKIDFLKDFKHEDPDDDKGKEKKKVKVSLTSKK